MIEICYDRFQSYDAAREYHEKLVEKIHEQCMKKEGYWEKLYDLFYLLASHEGHDVILQWLIDERIKPSTIEIYEEVCEEIRRKRKSVLVQQMETRNMKPKRTCRKEKCQFNDLGSNNFMFIKMHDFYCHFDWLYIRTLYWRKYYTMIEENFKDDKVNELLKEINK